MILSQFFLIRNFVLCFIGKLVRSVDKPVDKLGTAEKNLKFKI